MNRPPDHRPHVHSDGAAGPFRREDLRRTLRRRRHQAPRATRVSTLLLTFVGVTAVGGSAEMLIFPEGTTYVPGQWLEGIPLVDSWTVPGLTLGTLGVASLVTAGWSWRAAVHDSGEDRPGPGDPRPWRATMGIGVALLAWIGVEVAVIPERNVIELVYAATGITLVALAGNRVTTGTA